MTYATKWNYSGSQVKFSRSIGAVGVEIKNSYSNKNSGTYATTYYTTKQSARIIYYKSFKTLAQLRREKLLFMKLDIQLGYHILKVKIILFLL